MSDTPAESAPTAEDYVERTADEIQVLEQQFKGTGYSGRAYIAPPARGHDVKGLWHYFPAHTRHGYAAHGIALHKMLLDEMKIPTSLIPHRMAALDIDHFPKDRADMLTQWMVDAVGLPEAMLVSLPPDISMYDMARALVSYVAGPEATATNAHTVDIVNSENLTALWCVSHFTARAYTNAGAKADKVFTVRPPICDGVWRDMFTPLDKLAVPERGTFVFGTLGTWHERKGFYDLVRAYFSLFKRTDDVELHIRTSSMDSKLTIKKFEEKIIAEIAEIAKEFGDNNYPASKRQPRIKLLTGTGLTEQEVITWLGSLDCFVNASYGEGLGIPQMWALAQGVKLVTSDFGAVGEFQYPGAQPFKSKLVPVPASMRGYAPIWGDDAMWGGYDVADLANAMFNVACAGPKTRHPTVAEYVRSRFSYAGCRPDLEKALAHICRPEVLDRWLAP